MLNSTSSNESKTRKIEVVNDKIIYTLKLDNGCDYLSYDETLYNILCMNKLIPFRDCDRLRFKIHQHGTVLNLYLYDLAMACYMGRVTQNTVISDMRNFYDYKSRLCLEVDHLDNHTSNNTRFNLSLMPRSCNRSKHDITARVQIPSMLICCYMDGKYYVHYERRDMLPKIILGDMNVLLEKCRIPMMSNIETVTTSQDFCCIDAESLLSCLNEIIDRNITYKGVKIIPQMRNGRKWITPKNRCYLDNIETAIKAQEILAQRDKSLFQNWQA